MTPTEAINLLAEIDDALLDMNVRVSSVVEFSNLEDYTATSDSVDRCLDMVACQIQDTWLHVERAIARLEKLK